MHINEKLIKNKLNFEANSGASMNLLYENGKLLLLKTMKNDPRAVLNLKKQSEFFDLPNVAAVRILDVMHNGEYLKVKMPFVDGLVGSDYAIDCTHRDLTRIKRYLEEFFEKLKSKSVTREFNRSIVDNKIRELKSNKKFSSYHKKILGQLSKNLSSIKNYPCGPCHGDLTLSNIIFSPQQSKLYLIDFLEVYINSFVIDLVKLDQDLIYGWSSRYLSEIDQLRSDILCHQLRNGWPCSESFEWGEFYKILSVLNTLRIIPYCSDKATDIWITQTLISQEQFI